MHYLLKQMITWLPYPSQDLTSQVFIVSGSNTGLGYEAAKHLVRCNASKVILAVRNVEAGKKAAAEIEDATNTTEICSVWHLDMESYASVKGFAARMNRELDRIDGVLLNAGISYGQGRKAEEDEAVLTVNVVNTALLACLSIPILRKAARKSSTTPRISITSSGTHAWSQFLEQDADNIFDALNDPDYQNWIERYCVSKLLEVFVIRELAQKVSIQEQHPDVIINALAPGFCSTGLARHMSGIMAVAMSVRMALFARSAEQGSRTLVHAVLGGEETHGKYLADCNASEDALSDYVKSERGRQAQAKFWKELSTKLERIQPGVVKAIQNANQVKGVSAASG